MRIHRRGRKYQNTGEVMVSMDYDAYCTRFQKNDLNGRTEKYENVW